MSHDPIIIFDYCFRAGVIIERARRARRSLTYEERQIIAAGRNMAAEKGLKRHQLNAMEMAGEFDRTATLAPTVVKMVFAYYDEPYEDLPARPHYVVRESNHPALPPGGHVSGEDIISAGESIPRTPSYESWVRDGRKVVRR